MYITSNLHMNNVIFCGDKKAQIIYPRYRQVDKNFDKAVVSETINRRISKLPKLMNLMVSAPVEYVNGHANSKQFSSDYLDMSVPFYKRMNIGEHNKEYRKNYKPEINMIKKITKACDNYIFHNTSHTQLDSTIEKALDKYSKTPIKRTTLFIA